MTGKPRLPLPELGESLVSVVWNSDPRAVGALPRAQNCTHTLLMPHPALPLAPTDVVRILQPVFEFETVYGFA